jgi:peptidoglycan/xylan/chitin deacetylase (PgdA/CDA1 family)
MRFLAWCGYQVMSMDQALFALSGQRLMPRHGVVLTFDDGYQNFYDFAYPVLKAYHFPAIIYLVPGYLGAKAKWFARENRETPLLMDTKAILQLQAAGYVFGAHTMHHVRLAAQDPKTRVMEIEASKKELEKVLGQPVRHFCYPYGSYDRQVMQAVETAGFASAVTCLRAAARQGCHPLELPRKAISYGDSLVGFWWKLQMKNCLQKERYQF